MIKKQYFKAIFLLLNLGLITITSCQQSNVFDSVQPIPIEGFGYSDSLVYDVKINDTAAHYNLYITLRHKATYPYSNLWLKVGTRLPDNSYTSKDLSLPLCELSGKWYGTTIADIVSQKISIQPNATLSQGGVYTFSIMQNSRDSLVSDLLEMGIRLERIQPI